MKRYGYHRTSTKEQHLDRGILEITNYFSGGAPMPSTLSSLYYGSYSAFNRSHDPESEYMKTFSALSELEDEIERALSGDLKEKFKTYMEGKKFANDDYNESKDRVVALSEFLHDPATDGGDGGLGISSIVIYKKLYISYVIILIYNHIRNILYLYFAIVDVLSGLNL